MKMCKVQIFLGVPAGRYIGDSGNRRVVAQRSWRKRVCLAEGSVTATFDRGVRGLRDGGWRGSRRSECEQSRVAERAKGNDAETPAWTESLFFSYCRERNLSRGK